MNDLVITPHPLTLAGQTITRAVEALPGESLAALLVRSGVDLAQPGWRVTIGGAEVPELLWDRTRPRHGHLIECHRVAGKKVLRIVAFLVLAYFTFGAGAGAWLGAGGLGLTGFTLFAAQAGAFMLGSLVINKLLPPPAARAAQYQEQPLVYSITGGRNRARPFEPLVLVFGEVRTTPDFAAQPYSWFEGDDQILYVRLHGGINAGEVADLKIGNTSISAYSGVVITQSGFPGMTSQLLDWGNVDTIAGALLDAPTAMGPWVTRTSSANTVQLAIDIVASLYSMNSSGGMVNASVELEAEYRLLPSGLWQPFLGGGVSYFLLSSKATKPVRKSLMSAVLPAGQYEVRMRKRTANVSTTRAANTTEWAALRSFQEDPTDYSAHPHVGIRIKASGQLNGSLDEVNWLVKSAATDVWTGVAWVVESSRNPGAHMLQFARGIYDVDGRLMAGMGLPDSQIDIEALKGFMVHCAARGYVFDHAFSAQLSCMELLEAIASVGLGSVSQHTGKLGVVWLADDQPIRDVVTMANVKARSFRVDYATRETAEELEVTWSDRDNGWLPASVRMMAPGVTAPRDTARYAPLGVSTVAAGLTLGRFSMAQNIYQRKAVSWEMDLEHVTVPRYSLLRMSHDLTQWGRSGRVAACETVEGVVTLTLDEEVPYAPGAGGHYVGLRIPGELGYRVFPVAVFSGLSRQIELVGAWPAGVAKPGDASDNPPHDTLWIYDFQSQPGQRFRVVSIEPSQDMSGARLTAVPEGDEFWAYVAGGSYVAPPASVALPVLSASNVVVTQERIDLSYDDTTDLTITFDVSGPYDHAQIWGGPAGSELKYLGRTLTSSFTPWRVPNDGIVDVEVRPFDGLGRAGVVAATAHDVTLNEVVATSKLLRLQASSQVFQVNKVGSATPSAITLTASGQNLVGAPAFSVMVGTATLTGTGVTRSLAFGSMASDVVTVQVTWDGLVDQITLIKVREGSDAVNGLLSNESATVAADSAGTVTSFAAAGGEFRVWQGTTELTSGVTYSVFSASDVTLTIDAGTGVYSITAMAVDSASAVLRAVAGAVTIDKVYNISKSRAGVNGSTARTLVLTASSQVIQVNKAGTATPASVVLSAAGQNLTGSPSFSVASGTATLTGTGNSRSLAYGAMGSDVVTVQVSWDGLVDQTTVIKVREGSDAILAILTNETTTVPADSAGAVGSYATAVTYVKVYRGAVEETGSWSFTKVDSSGLTSTISGNLVTVTGMSVDSGYVDITASRSGYSPIPLLFTVSKARAGQDGTDAQVLSLTATSYLFQVGKTGTVSPSSIVVSAVAQGLAGSPAFTVVAGTATLTGSGTSRTLAYGSMSSETATIQVAWDGFVDTVTIAKVREGVDAFNVVLENESAVVSADPSGAVASYAGAGGEMRVWLGAAELTSGVTYSVASATAVTVAINASTGVFTVSGLTADNGSAVLRAVVGSVTLDKVYNISKSRSGADGVSPVASSLTRHAILLPADSNGLVSSYTDANSTVTVKLGAVDDTANWTISRTSTSGIVTSLSGATVTITSMSSGLDSGIVTITCTRGGYASEVLVLDVAKAKSAQPSAGAVPTWGPAFIEVDVDLGTATASATVGTDGRVYTGYYTNYYLPTTTGIGSSLYMRADVESGDVPSGTLGAVITVSAPRSYSLSQGPTVGSKSCRLRVTFFSDAAGTVVLGRGTIDIVATRSP